MARSALARHPPPGRGLGDRPGVRAWHREPYARGHQAGRRGEGMTNPQRRVVVTGIGMISPIGTGVAEVRAGLRRATSAVTTITRFDASQFRTHVAGEVKDFHATDFIEARRAKRLDLYSAYSIAASRLALDDAALDLQKEDR